MYGTKVEQFFLGTRNWYFEAKSGFQAHNLDMVRYFSYNLATLRVGLKSCCALKDRHFALFAPLRVGFLHFLALTLVRVRVAQGSTHVIFGSE